MTSIADQHCLHSEGELLWRGSWRPAVCMHGAHAPVQDLRRRAREGASNEVNDACSVSEGQRMRVLVQVIRGVMKWSGQGKGVQHSDRRTRTAQLGPAAAPLARMLGATTQAPVFCDW